MKLLHVYICLLLSLLSYSAISQEINCRVNVQSTDVPDLDKNIVSSLKQRVEDFMSNQVWTEHTYTVKEKIDVTLSIRITKFAMPNTFTATIQMQSSRPAYNATYATPIYNYVDAGMSFVFDDNQKIEISESSYISPLSSLLSFYGYLLIGLDYDSFGLLSGSPYYQKAQNISNTAVNASDPNWSTKGSEGKYWIIDNILNSSFVGYRNALYTYHRLGIDLMVDKPKEGRDNIKQALKELEKVYAIRPSSILLSTFFVPKKDEILQIFSTSTTEEKKEIVNMVKKMNPANSVFYDKLLK